MRFKLLTQKSAAGGPIYLVRVWKAEMSNRNLLVSFDYFQDTHGAMVVGEQCLRNLPGGIPLPYSMDEDREIKLH